MINYQFNKYRLSGQDAPVWSETAYQLCRTGVGNTSGQQLGEILYRYYLDGLELKELYRAYPYLSASNIRGLMRGKYCTETYIHFMTMFNNDPEMLDNLFKTTNKGAVKNG